LSRQQRSLGDLAALTYIEGGGPAELFALLPGLEDSGLGAGKDQRAFKFAKTRRSLVGNRTDNEDVVWFNHVIARSES
jgi:hypothetical protein